jgi:hypothetical protein
LPLVSLKRKAFWGVLSSTRKAAPEFVCGPSSPRPAFVTPSIFLSPRLDAQQVLASPAKLPIAPASSVLLARIAEAVLQTLLSSNHQLGRVAVSPITADAAGCEVISSFFEGAAISDSTCLGPFISRALARGSQSISALFYAALKLQSVKSRERLGIGKTQPYKLQCVGWQT